MADPLRAAFRKPFAEQVAAFRLRLGDLRPTQAWDDLAGPEHDRAFMVAGAMKADLLADLSRAVDSAIADGTTLERFRADFEEIVARHGWHGWTGEQSAKGRAWRTKVIYQTNIRSSYAAGRLAQLKAGAFAFWVYLHGGSLEPRENHLSWHGVALPPDHPFWAAHYPPNEFGCSCKTRGARNRAGILRVGGDPDKALPDNWQQIDPKTGTPIGIGRGWDHAPGATVVETVTVAADKIRKLPALIGAHFGQDMASQIERAWPIWLAEAKVSGRVQDTMLGTFQAPVAEMLANEKGILSNAGVWLRPGTVAGVKSRRHERAGDALTDDDILALPVLFQNPFAVFLDNRGGDIIMLMGSPERPIQATIELGRMVRADRQRQERNVLKSLYVAKLEGISGRLKGGLIELLMGGV